MSTDQAAKMAAEAALRQVETELWTLYAVGLASTLLRTYARMKGAGFSGLRAEDYLVWLGVSFYTIQTSLAFSVGHLAQGLANNGMTDAQRAAVEFGSQEYHFRVTGSKIQVAGWTIYSALIWSLKLSMLFFYTRLTEGLGRRYRIQIQIGFLLVLGTFLASVITIFAACRPFNHYWQISPNPGNACQPAVSLPIVWVSFAANVATDVYLIAIPVPMLWQSSLKTIKKIASTIVLGAGIFVLVCAILKSVFVLVDPVNGARLAGSWGVREAFVAVITTNLPVIFPLFRVWLAPLFGSVLQSSQKASYQTPSGFRTIGGGGGDQSRSRRGPRTANPITGNLSFNESEEYIVDGVKMESFKTSTKTTSGSGSRNTSPNGIVVSKDVRIQITREGGNMQDGHGVQRAREIW